MVKRILFLMRQPPYGTSHALEAIESILVAGVFEQQVTVLFKDDGVWQLAKHQDGSAVGTRTVANVLQALPEYDVTNLLVCAPSLVDRNLTCSDLVLPITEVSIAEQRDVIAAQDAVVND